MSNPKSMPLLQVAQAFTILHPYQFQIECQWQVQPVHDEISRLHALLLPAMENLTFCEVELETGKFVIAKEFDMLMVYPIASFNSLNFDVERIDQKKYNIICF